MFLSHNDDPTLHDGFGNDGLVREICGLIRNCTPPKGIGINGYWGTGKTSMLLQVCHQLTGVYPYGDKPPGLQPPENVDKTIMPIWFEAWRYQHEAQPVVALLNEIRLQMGMWKKLQDETAKLSGVTFLGALSAFDEVVKAASGGVFKPELGKVQAIGNAWEKERYQQPLPGQSIRNLLQGAVATTLKSKNKKKLAIFIDDLDRCEPETALRLMEGIKVYLNLNNCVIIFGMDQRQVERALVKALGLKNEDGAAMNAAHYAREYLEKICQDIIHLPLADKKQKSQYLNALLFELVPNEPQKIFVHRIKSITDQFDCLPANPRKIKALANRLASMIRRLEDLPQVQAHDIDIDREAAFCLVSAVIYCFHRRIFEQLQKNPAYISEVTAYAGDSDISKDVYSPMQGMQPSVNSAGELPVNPSDSNVFRLHQLLQKLAQITDIEIKPFLFP